MKQFSHLFHCCFRINTLRYIYLCFYLLVLTTSYLSTYERELILPTLRILLELNFN